MIPREPEETNPEKPEVKRDLRLNLSRIWRKPSPIQNRRQKITWTVGKELRRILLTINGV